MSGGHWRSSLPPTSSNTTHYEHALRGFHPSPPRLVRYYDFVTDGVRLHDRTALDVGGGSGLASFYMASKGARVTCLEPGGDGAADDLPAIYEHLDSRLGRSLSVALDRRTLQELDPDSDTRFDVIMIHNAVNHLAEGSCARLLHDEDAQGEYRAIFTTVRELTAAGGYLIVADCARRNLLGNLHLPNPFAPGIDWTIHQQPSTWIRLLHEAGFHDARVRWDAPSRTGTAGQAILGNRLGGWLANSHFIITMKG